MSEPVVTFPPLLLTPWRAIVKLLISAKVPATNQPLIESEKPLSVLHLPGFFPPRFSTTTTRATNIRGILRNRLSCRDSDAPRASQSDASLQIRRNATRVATGARTLVSRILFPRATPPATFPKFTTAPETEDAAWREEICIPQGGFAPDRYFPTRNCPSIFRHHDLSV